MDWEDVQLIIDVITAVIAVGAVAVAVWAVRRSGIRARDAVAAAQSAELATARANDILIEMKRLRVDVAQLAAIVRGAKHADSDSAR